MSATLSIDSMLDAKSTTSWLGKWKLVSQVD